MKDSENRWLIAGDGIEWNVERDRSPVHEDHLEMSGLMVSLIARYGVAADGSLLLKRHLVWPSLRTIPNNTHASFQASIADDELPSFAMDGKILAERPKLIRFDGVLTIACASERGLETRRELFPSAGSRAAMELITITNKSSKALSIEARDGKAPKCGRGCNGVYLVESRLDAPGETALAPGESRSFALTLSARIANEPYESLNAEAELLRRRARVAELTEPLALETGVPEIDAAFRFAKLRAGESIFKTRGGLLHSPGGGSYYAATWCNDQIEYAGPWFAFTGDKIAMEASLNAYRQYMPFMGPGYERMPSSVIAEGFDIWEGAGDRGDAAMYAYGASRFALASGSGAIASELWPAIEWTLEYCRRMLTPEGAVASDTDELEGRIPAGKANLCTSSLYYGGLRSASCLASELKLPGPAARYAAQADELERCIESHFGRSLQGFETYRYYDGNESLRSWICIPLCMGILKRASGTVKAMFSPRLWTENGMLSQEGDKAFWDRSALYGFRGGLIAGAGSLVFGKLREYSRRRLLGEHAPYPVEAWPEGGQRHLSAESALYCRVVTEGLFGIEPKGLRSFALTPRLPESCERMSLRGIKAFGTQFDIVVERSGAKVERGGKTVWQGQPGGLVEL